MYKLVNTTEALSFAVPALLSEFAADGVTYMELRTTPRALSDASAEEAVELVVSELRRWNDTNAMKVRLILSVDQAKHDASDAEWIVDLALRLRREYAPVVGIDLCGDPNAASARDLSAFTPAFERAREGGLGIVVHFGETPEQAQNGVLDTMLSWQPRRVGHAIYVPDAMRDDIVKRGIASELCLTCNVLANMLPQKDGARATVADHHFGWWWEHGGSISLGTDDVGVFGASPSEEHLQAAEHFGLSKHQLVELSQRAIQGALDESAISGVERGLDSFVVLERM